MQPTNELNSTVIGNHPYRRKYSTTNISLSSVDIQTNVLLWIWDGAEEQMLYQMQVITLAQSIFLSYYFI